MLVCLVFVVATVFQLSLLMILKKKFDGKIFSLELGRATSNKAIRENQEQLNRIDNICMKIFPFLFSLFNGIYLAIML